MLDVIDFGGPARAQRRHVYHSKAPRHAASRWIDPIQRKSMEAQAPPPMLHGLPGIGFGFLDGLGFYTEQVEFEVSKRGTCTATNPVAKAAFEKLQRASSYYALSAGFKAPSIGGGLGKESLAAIRGAAKYIFDELYRRGQGTAAENPVIKNAAFATGCAGIAANADELVAWFEKYAAEWNLFATAVAAPASSGKKPSAAKEEKAPVKEEKAPPATTGGGGGFLNNVPAWALALAAGGLAYVVLRPKKRAALGCPCEM